MLAHIFKYYVCLQEHGFIFHLCLNAEKPFEVVFKPVIQLILGDCKGADVLCGRYGSHHRVKKLCRDCNVKLRDADNPNYCCESHIWIL